MNKAIAKATSQEKFWANTIDSWKPKSKNERDRLERHAMSYRSKHWKTQGPVEDDDTTVETNMFYAFADTMIANIVPLNPAVTVVANRDQNAEAASLREALINTVFDREGLTEKLWKVGTRATVWPRAWMKAVWSEQRKRPILRVINPHYVWYDATAEDYEDCRYIIEVTPLSKAEFEARMRKSGKKGGWYRPDALDDRSVTFGKWPDWLEPNEEDRGSDETSASAIVRGEYEWTVVYEVYDFRGRKFYHYADGCDRPLFCGDLPYEFLPNPYLLVTFNDNLQDLGGMSDSDLIYSLVERQNTMDSLEMAHTRTSIPSTVVHGGLLDDPDAFMDAYEEVDGPGQVIIMNAKPGIGIGQVLGQTPSPQLPVEWGRVQSRLEKNIEFTLGLPSYARGELGQSDVATELALSDTATRTRNARRQKVIYRAIAWCSKAIVALYQEYMPEDEEIPLRLTTTEDETTATRELLGFGKKGGDDPWAYDYKVHPFSAEEANSIVQLKQMTTYLPVYMEGMKMGHIDARAFFKKLTDLQGWPQLLTKNPPPQGGVPPGMPLQQPGAPKGGLGQGMPPAMMGPAMGGQVEVGTGAQAVPFGLEGGAQPGAPAPHGALGGMAPFQK